MKDAEDLVVRMVYLEGDHTQIGIDQSKELEYESLRKQVNLLQRSTEHADASKGKRALQRIAPTLLNELKGLAKGLSTPIETIIKRYSGYNMLFPKMGCTALVRDGHYVGNYDFSPDLYDARLVFLKPTYGFASVGFSHQLIGRLDGMNEKGLVVGLHFVNNTEKEEGFSAPTIVRILLESCRNIDEAITTLMTLPHAHCYNYSLTDRSGESAVVEASPRFQVTTRTTCLSCTNHFESKRLRGENRQQISGSLKRKEHLKTMLVKKASPWSLYHQFNNDGSPLFYKDYQAYFGTLHTVVYSPKELSLIVGVGENCDPRMFSFKDYVDGSPIPFRFLQGSIKQA
ncbi:C45 family autoproteolytic acyltransferase/hydolase [Bacillus sp. JCM 19041]|uniref:C45 family autoproteolytic acyltransferase/hydolase n=1 Tax=Bacillus sp. JCM 19041 TaxID=1460637 RepID=UPI000AE64278